MQVIIELLYCFRFEIALPRNDSQLLVPCRLPLKRPAFHVPTHGQWSLSGVFVEIAKTLYCNHNFILQLYGEWV